MQKSECRSQNAEVRMQKSECRSQNAEVRMQGDGVPCLCEALIPRSPRSALRASAAEARRISRACCGNDIWDHATRVRSGEATWTPRTSHTWRCARPRARSSQGDGTHCLRLPSAKALPGCGRDARAPKGRSALRALAAEARRISRASCGNDIWDHATRVRSGEATWTPGTSHTWRCARPRARSPQGDGVPCRSQPIPHSDFCILHSPSQIGT
jgi:hypothetical protein